jgi:hypothetical protein
MLLINPLFLTRRISAPQEAIIHLHEVSFQQLSASTCMHRQVHTCETSRGRGPVPGDSPNFVSALCQISERDSNQRSFEKRVSTDRRSSGLVQKIVFATRFSNGGSKIRSRQPEFQNERCAPPEIPPPVSQNCKTVVQRYDSVSQNFEMEV